MPRSDLLIYLTIGFGLLFGTGCTRGAGMDAGSQTSPISGYRVFEGAWFEITYPAAFTPVPSLVSRTAEGYDSAEFVSPDERVAFYVFSPQWGGDPVDIAVDPERETLVSERRAEQEGRTIRWFTICATDGAYCRSYQDTSAQEGSLRTVFGIRYQSEDDRLEHLGDYIRFRRSLEAYAD